MAQPSLEATRSVYSFDVAHSMKVLAASTFLVPAGMPRLQAHSQFARLSMPSLFGARAKPTLSATVEFLGSVTKDAATVASIQIPHLPCWNSARFSLKPLADAPGGP